MNNINCVKRVLVRLFFERKLWNNHYGLSLRFISASSLPKISLKRTTLAANHSKYSTSLFFSNGEATFFRRTIRDATDASTHSNSAPISLSILSLFSSKRLYTALFFEIYSSHERRFFCEFSDRDTCTSELPILTLYQC